MPTGVNASNLVGNFTLDTDPRAVGLSEAAMLVTISNQGADDAYYQFSQRDNITDGAILPAGERVTFIYKERGQHRSVFLRAVNTTTDVVILTDAEEGRFAP